MEHYLTTFFLNCERGLAREITFLFKFTSQFVKQKLSPCVKTNFQTTWTLAEEERTRSKATRQLSENLVFVLTIKFYLIQVVLLQSQAQNN